MSQPIELHDLTDEEVALVKGFVEMLRRRHAAPRAAREDEDKERGWVELAVGAFAEDWDNDTDAVYDHWRERYGVPER